MTTLADLTTLRVGGPSRDLLTVTSRAQFLDAIRDCDARGEPFLIIGGGSNIVASDAGFPGTLIVVRSRGIEVSADSCGGAWVEVAAGEPWDDFVSTAVNSGWIGVEALSGIPGCVGATPIQNVGAYGQEVASTIARVEVLDRTDGQVTWWPVGECGFGYRTSRFKQTMSARGEPRYVVLTVAFQFSRGDLSTPIAYRELADHLGVQMGERVPATRVREAVLELRRAKGMVWDPADHDTCSVGSFFINPVLTTEQARALPEDAPRWILDDGLVKVSAAWLVQQAGFTRGFGLVESVRLSSKHALAITHRGGGTAAEVVDLADHIAAGVFQRFGVQLTPEPLVLQERS